jgi:hypothetical protein
MLMVFCIRALAEEEEEEESEVTGEGDTGGVGVVGCGSAIKMTSIRYHQK